eukprot:1353959-Pleurochrysis_carterae.AAC.1
MYVSWFPKSGCGTSRYRWTSQSRANECPGTRHIHRDQRRAMDLQACGVLEMYEQKLQRGVRLGILSHGKAVRNGSKCYFRVRAGWSSSCESAPRTS